jgi:phosphosulfolactate synthase
MTERETTGGDLGLETKAFGFLRVPTRSAKPRSHGLTILSDKHLGPRAVEDLLETGADYLDWVKVSMGSARVLTEDVLRQKITLYRAADVRVLLTGDVFELAVNQGAVRRVYDTAASLGFDGVEMATAQTILSLDAKATLVGLAKHCGLTAIAEIGQKGVYDRPADGSWLAHEGRVLQEAGADMILLQGEGIMEGVDVIDAAALYAVASHLGTARVIYQAKDERAQAWFIENFGPEANLDIDMGQLLRLELMRRGLRKRGLYGLVSSPRPDDVAT